MNAWKAPLSTIDNQWDLFNGEVKNITSKAKPDSINEASQKLNVFFEEIEKNIAFLKESSRQASDREKKLSQRSFIPQLTKNNLICISTGVITSATSVASFVLTSIPKLDSARNILIVSYALSEIGSLISTLYSANTNKTYDETIRFLQKDKQCITNAENMGHFISLFKDILNLPVHNNALLQNKDHVAIDIEPSVESADLDSQVKKCIETYEKLPYNYRPLDIYNRIISIFMQKYPLDDPLQQSLAALSTKPFKAYPLNLSQQENPISEVAEWPPSEQAADEEFSLEPFSSDPHLSEAIETCRTLVFDRWQLKNKPTEFYMIR